MLDVVRRYPLPAYFTLAYGISWLGWVPYVLSLDGFGVLPFRFPELLGDTQLFGILPGAYLGPLTAAFTVTAVAEGRDGLRRWRRRLFRWRVAWPWYAFVLVGFPALLLLGGLVLPGAWAELRIPSLALLATYIPMLVLQVLTTGLAEEPGWRDFALPRLQQRWGPLPGTIVLGCLWAGWHLPLFLTSWAGSTVTPMSLFQFLLLGVVFSIVITWVFNRTQQSLPMIMLLHSTLNNFQSVAWPEFFPGLDADWTWGPVIGICVLAAVLVVTTRGRLGYDPALTTRSPAAPSVRHPSGA
ncbi:CPBP family intramembrane glutamic endopeptidase [Actinomycetes bacterium KLBMP 9759]